MKDVMNVKVELWLKGIGAYIMQPPKGSQLPLLSREETKHDRKRADWRRSGLGKSLRLTAPGQALAGWGR